MADSSAADVKPTEPIHEEEHPAPARDTTEVAVAESTDGADSSTTDGFKDYDKARVAFREGDVALAEAEHRKKMNHNEDHGGAGSDYIKSIVFGGLDGIITTFAIISAAAGSGSDYKTVLIFGFANVLADAFSMGFGEFISGSAERDYALKEREREMWEVQNIFEREVAEMEEVYEKKGLSKEDAKTVVGIISKDPKIFVDFMMVDELGLLVDVDDKYGALKQGLVMFTSFVFFGLIPIYAYLSGKGKGTDYIFGISCGLTAFALLILGATKGFLTSMNVPISALIMLFNGAVSGGASYGIGALVEYIVATA